ncbi:hypothetical protein EVJ32_04570 [Exiguobacterium sp. SH5S4]|uniref:tyrosine-type recombinase/integrase n=1 Tax=Exiguobacterium sp. SH5S4 TaxID=2510961 RepID=UPI00103A94FE|nr:tyrosine-type recombinase/integrase [Exiguobacterium sp. SH5S4]TCI26651.1 hypothetical protein EVJ32_04570 [Exiguobacterium sp. SH5S4]
MEAIKTVALNTTNIQSNIRLFLDKKGLNSDQTRRAYERDIEEFFIFSKNKAVSGLLESDVSFSPQDVDKYLVHLSEKGTASSTINRKVVSVRSLMRYLDRLDGYDINLSAFDTGSVKGAQNSYGVLTYEETEMMASRVLSHRNGQMKAALIRLAVVTSFRLDSLLRLTKTDFMNQRGVWTVTTVGKGGERDTKAIRDELYEEIRMIMMFKEDDEPIFKLSPGTALNMVKGLSEEMGVPKERNITFHSLKKAGVTEVWVQTGYDAMKTKKQGAHKNFSTTERYIENNEDFSQSQSLLIGKEIDLSMLDGLSKDELLEFINGMNRSVKMQIKNEIKKKGMA